MRAALHPLCLDSPPSLPQHRTGPMAHRGDTGGVIAAVDAMGLVGVIATRENKHAIQDATGFARSGGLAGRLR